MVTKDTLAAAKLKASHSTVTLLKFGDTGANFLNHTHELMPQHITLLHAYSTTNILETYHSLLVSDDEPPGSARYNFTDTAPSRTQRVDR